MSKKAIFYTAFFVFLSIAFYLTAVYFIPGFNKRKLEPISKVGQFTFTDQDGKPFSNKDVEGKLYVTEYFYTTCPGICPMMNNNMKQVYEKYKGTPGFLIVSHTCDPENDSAAQLKHYADSMKVDTRQWVFLTGRKDSLYKMARLSYTIDDPKNYLNSNEDDFLHTQFWALVDGKGNVLKIYDGLKQKEINRLIADIADELKNASKIN
ncbi:SCO family protein [Niabella beijingensis]|uniref:SCO family protein n=1 Tax=Niabella beijingensis TaxID=2872700 RepID=UPI001CBDD42D|nr:SCO family protein [Niabella beijingensis]MBZ4188792.1 SCO family protein [Niabella beijingensis]